MRSSHYKFFGLQPGFERSQLHFIIGFIHFQHFSVKSFHIISMIPLLFAWLWADDPRVFFGVAHWQSGAQTGYSTIRNCLWKIVPTCWTILVLLLLGSSRKISTQSRPKFVAGSRSSWRWLCDPKDLSTHHMTRVMEDEILVVRGTPGPLMWMAN